MRNHAVVRLSRNLLNATVRLRFTLLDSGSIWLNVIGNFLYSSLWLALIYAFPQGLPHPPRHLKKLGIPTE
jgi:hypothetical protein